MPVDLSDCQSLSCKGCNNIVGEQLQWGQHTTIYEAAGQSAESDVAAGVRGGRGKRIPVAKKPKGRWCKPCMKTFYAAGWDTTFKSLNEYIKFANTPDGRAKHQEFL